MEFKQKRACIVYSIIALFMALVYSYKDAIWVNEQYAMYFKRGDTSTPIYNIGFLYRNGSIAVNLGKS